MKLIEELHNQRENLKDEMKEHQKKVRLLKGMTTDKMIIFLFFCHLVSFVEPRKIIWLINGW